MDPNLVTTLSALPGVGHYAAIIIPWLSLIVALAAFSARFFPPPAKPTGVYAALYSFVNWAGQNSGHATNANAPGVTQVAQAVVKSLAMLIGLGLVLSLVACSSQQMAEGSAIASDLAPVAAQITVDKASQPQLAELQGLCGKNDAAMADANAVLGGGAAQTAGKVDAPLDAFCKIVKQGKVPANADGNSVNWGQTAIIATIKTIAALAGR